MSFAPQHLKHIIEAALLSAGEPLNMKALRGLFAEHEEPSSEELHAALQALTEDCQNRAIELKQVASGWRFQVREQWSPWVSRLHEEKPQRYTRALLETLALIAYRQPITRGEIEDVRGVSVSSNIIRTLTEREWIRVVGHRDVPGRPAMYATTRQFLDYFNLKSLEGLPALSEIKSLDEIAEQAEEVLSEALQKAGLTVEDIAAEQQQRAASVQTAEEDTTDSEQEQSEKQPAVAASPDGEDSESSENHEYSEYHEVLDDEAFAAEDMDDIGQSADEHETLIAALPPYSGNTH